MNLERGGRSLKQWRFQEMMMKFAKVKETCDLDV